jgi:hypothetical protein
MLWDASRTYDTGRRRIMTARAERIALLIKEGRFHRETLEAIAADGNELSCGIAKVLGLPFEAWLQFVQQPHSDDKAERWARKVLAEIDEIG